MRLARRFRDRVALGVRRIPLAWHLSARVRRWRYEQRIRRFRRRRDGRADRVPLGIVYEATMRCNLHCEFCYVGDLLNIEGEWRQELKTDVLERAFPEKAGLQVSLTGGEIFMRRDILTVFDVFRRKGYACGYLTTNGTIIDDARADALADLARAGFLKHISVSIDGPGEIHDRARGQQGTFVRTAEGLRRLQKAAAAKQARLRISINTTVTQEGLDSLDEMVDVAEELGVDAIGVNHLMFATPDEARETARLMGAPDASIITTYVTPDPGLPSSLVRQKLQRLQRRCAERNLRFDVRPKVSQAVLDRYYNAGTPLAGRCFYPFLHARVSFSGKVYFCPFIRIEVGDLTQSSLEEIWNGDEYMRLRRILLERGLLPVCQRCCKVELSPLPIEAAGETTVPSRVIPLRVAQG